MIAMNATHTLKKKILTLFQFLKFARRYPAVLIVGAPKIVRLLHANCREKSSTFYSQAGQDLFILSEFFSKITSPNFPKTFLDVGANHPVTFNNSYFFEKFLGFQTFAVDAIAKHNESWRTIRPNATFLNVAVGSSDGASVSFEVFDGVGNEDMYSAVVGASGKTISEMSAQTLSVTTRTLSSLLAQWNLGKVGILSIDIEGFELAAIQGLDFTKTSPGILVIENNTVGILGDEAIRLHLSQVGYVFYARFWGLDDVFAHHSLLA